MQWPVCRASAWLNVIYGKGTTLASQYLHPIGEVMNQTMFKSILRTVATWEYTAVVQSVRNIRVHPDYQP